MQKVSLIISILALISLLGYIAYDQFKPLRVLYPSGSPEQTGFFTPKPNNTTPPNQPSANPEVMGSVEGSISYPSETIPKDLEVCAETPEKILVKCTNQHIKDSKYTYGVGYKLELPPGKYYIYSRVPSMQNSYKAYYNEFVTCGLSVNCPSHDLIEVEVKAGETIKGIDPHDWYNPSQNQ